MDFWDESESMLCEVGNYANLIVLRTCSKSVALAGIRLGFAVACETLTKALRTIKSPFNLNSITQSIGAAILSDVDGYKRSIAILKEQTLQLKAALDTLCIFDSVYDTKTNFVFVATSYSEDIYEHLLSKGIAVRCFHNHLRICTGTPDKVKLLLKELREWKNLTQK
jgi:histidinol-phosphate aminotransferase